MVNKDWQHYYLSIMVVSSLLFIYKKNFTRIVLSVAIILNVFFNAPRIYNIFNKNPIKTIHEEQNQELLTIFKHIQDIQKINILISSYTPFEFSKVGLKYSQIHYIWGGGIDLETGAIDTFAIINIRPQDNNPSQEILDENIRKEFTSLVKKYFNGKQVKR